MASGAYMRPQGCFSEPVLEVTPVVRFAQSVTELPTVVSSFTTSLDTCINREFFTGCPLLERAGVFWASASFGIALVAIYCWRKAKARHVVSPSRVSGGGVCLPVTARCFVANSPDFHGVEFATCSVFSSVSREEQTEFILDSGASHHVCGDIQLVKKFTGASINLCVADRQLPSKARVFEFVPNDLGLHMGIYHESLSISLLVSVCVLEDNGFDVSFSQRKGRFIQNDFGFSREFRRDEGCYLLQVSFSRSFSVECLATIAKPIETQIQANYPDKSPNFSSSGGSVSARDVMRGDARTTSSGDGKILDESVTSSPGSSEVSTISQQTPSVSPKRSPKPVILKKRVKKSDAKHSFPPMLHNETKLDYHRRMGHCHIPGFSLGKVTCPDCAACKSGGRGHKTDRGDEHRVQQAMEKVDWDFQGPFPPSYWSKKYLFIGICQFSRWEECFPCETKDECGEKLEWYVNNVAKPSVCRSDNAAEFKGENSGWRNMCKKHSIKTEYSSPYCPQENSIVERCNRTDADLIRTNCRGVDKRMWCRASKFVAHTRNRLPRATLGGKSPFEVRHNRVPSTRYFRRFGCLAFAKTHVKGGLTKLCDRYSPGAFLGHGDKNSTCHWSTGSRRKIQRRTQV